MEHVLRFDEHGGAEVLRWSEEAPPALAPGEALLRVRAYALNPSDGLIRSGRFFERPPLPSRVGYDAAGIVENVCAPTGSVAVGDRVFTLPAFLQGSNGVQGSWAIVPAYALAPLPATVDFDVGAALGVQYTTAYFALAEIGAVRQGDTVLVTAAAGNTGLAAIQVVHAAGGRVAAVARSESEDDTLRRRGVDVVVQAGSDEAVTTALLAATDGAGVRVIYDGIGGPRARLYGDRLAHAGEVILYGFLDGDVLPLAGIPLYRKGARISFYQVFHFTGTSGTPSNLAALDRARAFFARELASGALAPEIGDRFRAKQFRAAYARAESGGARGKIVCVCE